MSALDRFDQLVEALKTLEFAGAQLRVVTRLADVNPPCALVAIAEIDHPVMDPDNDELTVRVFLVAGDVDEHRAIRSLMPLLGVIRPIVPPTEPTQVVELRTPAQTVGLPALQVTTKII